VVRHVVLQSKRAKSCSKTILLCYSSESC